MKENITVKEIISILFKKIYFLIICLAVGALLFFGYSKLFIKPEYSVRLGLTVSSLSAELDKPDNLSYSIIDASNSLVKTILVVLPSSTLYDSVAEDTGYSRNEIASAVSFSGTSDTFVLNCGVKTDSPEKSYNIALALAADIPDYINSNALGSAYVFSPINIPTAPSSPNIAQNTAIGAIAGLLIAAVIVVVLAMLDNTVKGEEDLAGQIAAPVLSEIPTLNNSKKRRRISRISYFRNKQLKKLVTNGSEDIINSTTPFRIAESYKQLRTNLLFAVSVSNKNVIIVSSGMPNEGKSTTACNIAISMAQSGKKMLLLDSDMRKPTLHKKMRLDNRRGLSGILSGQYGLDEALQTGVSQNLDVITAGAIPPNPSELLGSDSMSNFIDTVSKSYDFVIIDTPPLAVVSDARSFASKTAGILLVARQNVTLYSDIQRTVQAIGQSESNVLGIVITDVDQNEKIYGSYYGGHYSYRYSYRYSAEAYAENSGKSKVDLKDDN